MKFQIFRHCFIAALIAISGCAVSNRGSTAISVKPTTTEEIVAYLNALDAGVPVATIVSDLGITVPPSRTYAPAYGETGWRFIYKTGKHHIEFRAVGKDVRDKTDFKYVGEPLVLTHEQAAEQLRELQREQENALSRVHNER